MDEPSSFEVSGKYKDHLDSRAMVEINANAKDFGEYFYGNDADRPTVPNPL
jgi:hypothetical protein